MAKILEAKEINLEWSDIEKRIQHPFPRHRRSGGLHVSAILRKIAIDLGRLQEDDREDEMPLRVILGMGWEWFIAGLYPEMKWQPPELELDGIKGSPDGVTKKFRTDPLEPVPDKRFKPGVIEEFKLTSKSLRVKGGKETDYRDIRREWLWMCQLMAYLKMAQTRYGRFHVGWEMGAYTYPLRPRYFTYLLEFDQAELDSNWQMILTAKEGM